uniref:PISTILLATA-like protein n=1 Tax=Nuphar japonica TaxID=54801 RepID=Q68BG6_9MAGN|nr:PISTILLATA-like protein [Nuphar japonica]
MGRGKIEIKRIENASNRQVTFSKRKQGILKKAKEISVLCDAQVSLILFSSAGKLYNYCSPSSSLKDILTRYQKSSGKKLWDARHEYLSTELDRIRKENENMQIELRHFMGEDLSSLTVQELRALEDSLQIGFDNVHVKQTECLNNDIHILKKNERILEEENRQMKYILHQQEQMALRELRDIDLGSNNKGKGYPSQSGVQPFGCRVQPIQPNLQHNK